MMWKPRNYAILAACVWWTAGCMSLLDQCASDADCPGSPPCMRGVCESGKCEQRSVGPSSLGEVADNPCRVRQCTSAGKVEVAHQTKGTLVKGSPKGDCKQWVCDGGGLVVEALDPTDTGSDANLCTADLCSGGSPLYDPYPLGHRVGPGSAVGDCRSLRCDGAGNAAEATDPQDVPNDGLVCTKDVCVEGLPKNVPIAAGVTVSDGIDGNCSAVMCADAPSQSKPAPDASDLPPAEGACLMGRCVDGKPAQLPAPTGTVCDSVGSTCKTDGRCDRCPEVDASCADNGFGEPNDVSGQAKELGTLSDRDLFKTWPHVCGVLKGKDDVDWYSYFGNDSSGIVDPGRFFRKDAGVQVCAFFKCEKSSDSPSFSCPTPTVSAVSSAESGAMPGCCGLAPFQVDLDCLPSGGLFGDDNAQVFLRVSATDSAKSCQPYELRFHY